MKHGTSNVSMPATAALLDPDIDLRIFRPLHHGFAVAEETQRAALQPAVLDSDGTAAQDLCGIGKQHRRFGW
jgi:putative heme degradation protein